jgi:hypothetical protein
MINKIFNILGEKVFEISHPRKKNLWNAVMILGLIALLFMKVCEVNAKTLYVAKTGADGSNNCTSQISPCLTIANGISKMSGGDTLLIGDGAYSGSISSVPAGSSGAYTTIKAQNMQKVVVIGSITINSGYVILDGLKVNGNGGANPVIFIYGANHVKVTRCCAYGAASSGNVTVIDSTNSSYVLFEECWSWGTGRYKFISYQSDHVIFRRCVARHDYHDPANYGNQCGNFVNYDADSTLFQNCIAIDSTGLAGNSYGEIWGVFWCENNGAVSTNLGIKGSIILNCNSKYCAIHDPKATAAHTIQNTVVYDARGGYFADVASGSPTVALSNMTIGKISGTYSGDWDNPSWGSGTEIMTGFASATLRNSISFNNTSYGITRNTNSDYNDFYGNGTAASGGSPIPAVGAHSITTNPRSSSLTYLPRIESGSPLKTAGESGGQIGAQIMYQHGTTGTLWGETGYDTLTSTAPWPFPNEALIKADFASYPGSGPSGARGFCTGTSRDGSSQSLTKYIWEYLGNQIPSDIYGSVSTIPPSPKMLKLN